MYNYLSSLVFLSLGSYPYPLSILLKKSTEDIQNLCLIALKLLINKKSNFVALSRFCSAVSFYISIDFRDCCSITTPSSETNFSPRPILGGSSCPKFPKPWSYWPKISIHVVQSDPVYCLIRVFVYFTFKDSKPNFCSCATILKLSRYSDILTPCVCYFNTVMRNCCLWYYVDLLHLSLE